MPGYRSTLVEQQADGTALTNSTSETSILNPQTKITLPSGYLNRVGRHLYVTASGRISTVVTSPGTLTFKFKLGPTANIAVATSQAIALNVVAKTNVAWVLELDLLVSSVGASTSATIFGQGFWISEANIGAPVPGTGAPTAAPFQVSAPAVGTGFDSSVANQIDLTATWSTSNASNSIQCHLFSLEDLTTTP
jgi:hypothetical protein